MLHSRRGGQLATRAVGNIANLDQMPAEARSNMNGEAVRSDTFCETAPQYPRIAAQRNLRAETPAAPSLDEFVRDVTGR